MFVIVVFLTVFFMDISTEEKFDCTAQKDESFHPDDDCRFYWHCMVVDAAYTRAVKRACPTGTIFDSRTKDCEWTSSVSILQSSSFRIQLHLLLKQIDCVPIKTLPTTPRRKQQHRKNLSLSIFISGERRIRRFPFYSSSGILVHCNEIRRRRLRDLIFRPVPIVRNGSLENLSLWYIVFNNLSDFYKNKWLKKNKRKFRCVLFSSVISRFSFYEIMVECGQLTLEGKENKNRVRERVEFEGESEGTQNTGEKLT